MNITPYFTYVQVIFALNDYLIKIFIHVTK